MKNDTMLVNVSSVEELDATSRVVLQYGKWCKTFYVDEEPDDAALHESCTDCPLYDHDRHMCPRFNKVIPATIQEIQDTQPRMRGKWIKNDNGTYTCSVCQSWIPEEQHHYARYCLYCGADMREEMRNE